jgi:predicted ABC-type ATPase
MKYPLFSKEKNMLRTMNKNNSIMSNVLGKDFRMASKIQKDALRGIDSYHKYSKDGVFNKSREQFHKTILNNQFKDKSSVDRKDPDLYVFGGVAASGKSTSFRQKVKEPVIIIDPDGYKKELSKKDPSPIKSKPLGHAGFLHEESSHIKDEAVFRALKEKRNTVLDITMANREKQMRVVERFKDQGYDVHFMGTQLKPVDSMDRARKRFISGKDGRYVPMEAIYASGNTINKNVWLVARSKDVDSSLVVDSTPNPSRVVYRRGSVKRNYRDPKTS